jgi:hypothetical protein
MEGGEVGAVQGHERARYSTMTDNTKDATVFALLFFSIMQ